MLTFKPDLINFPFFISRCELNANPSSKPGNANFKLLFVVSNSPLRLRLEVCDRRTLIFLHAQFFLETMERWKFTFLKVFARNSAWRIGNDF